MTQTLMAWLIIGCCAAYLVRHFVQAWQSIAKGKSNCGSCGHCGKASEVKPITLVPRSQIVGMDSLLTAERQRPSRGSNDASHQKM